MPEGEESPVKKTVLLNQPLSAVIAGLGHTDSLVVSDAGLPIPTGPQRIDLAVRAGVPGFLDVLRTALAEMEVQEAIIATELATSSPAFHSALLEALGEIPIRAVPHEEFKRLTASARAVARTGEFTPYANVILIAGVVF